MLHRGLGYLCAAMYYIKDYNIYFYLLLGRFAHCQIIFNTRSYLYDCISVSGSCKV